MEEKDKNILLQSEIEELTKKLDYAKSQSSIDESSQASSHPWSQSSIPLLKTEKQGCVKQYSTEMFRLSIILIISCKLLTEIIPSVLNCIRVAAQIRHLDLPKTCYNLKISGLLRPLNEKLNRAFAAKRSLLPFASMGVHSKQIMDVFGLSYS